MTSPEPPRLLTIDSNAVSEILARSQSGISASRVSLRVLVSRDQVTWVSSLIAAADGAVEELRENDEASLLSLAFNHVTERVLNEVPGYCHLQISGPHLKSVQTAAGRELPGLMTHLDGFKMNEEPGYVGIVFHPYDGPRSIQNAKRILAEHLVPVNDPHVWYLQKNLDIYREAAIAMDPRALMNPGKLPPEGT